MSEYLLIASAYLALKIVAVVFAVVIGLSLWGAWHGLINLIQNIWS